MRTIAILAMLLIVETAQGASVGLFHDPTLPVHGAPSSADHLQKLLVDAGYTVKRLNTAHLMNESVLDASNLDLLVLPQGESYPAKGRDVLFRYLEQGGDFISMGGYAFDRLCYQDSGGKWRPKEELFGKLEIQSEPVTLFDFEGPLDGWKPGGGTAEMPTPKSGAGRAGGKSIEVHIPNYWNYHGVTSDISAPIPPGSNFISFWARGDANTPEISVECDEKDGSRWIAVVEITPEWTKYDVPATDFKHWHDATSRRDELHVDNAKSLSFGVAFTHTKRLMQGPHTFWIDDVQAVKGDITDPGDDRISTRFCDRRITDLVGVFDASCPLKWVTQGESNPDQLFLPDLKLTGDYTGWTAIGSFEEAASRWVPLITAKDRFGRSRGSLASIVIHYSGDRAGSVWAFFGVNNSDLFKAPGMSKAFIQLVNVMTRGAYLNQTGADLACYRVGEEAKVSTTVSNFGKARPTVAVRLQIADDAGDILASRAEEVSLAPGESKQVVHTWTVPETAPDFCRISARLLLNGRPIDIEEAAFTVWDERVLKSGPKLTYENGRFKLDGAPRMLFGSNETSAFWLGLAQNNPLGWDKEIRAMANDGLRVIRVHTAPQFFWPTEDSPNDAQFRKLDAWVQLCRKHGIAPYIDVMDWAEGLKDPWLRGGDYMMDDVGLRGQRKYVTAFASRYKDVPGMLWDADNEVVDNRRPNPVRTRLWNEWLAAEYGSTEGLEKAWGKYLNGEKLGEVTYNPGPDVWANRRSFDWRYCHRTNIRDRFVRNFADAVREADPDAVASISGLNIGGMDQFTVTEPLDLADNHFYHSLHLLPNVIKTSDLRPTGISSAIGEYGCITHPGRRDGGYYFPPDEQITRFLWIGHYLAGCGGSMALNWDFRDPLSGSFPWGVHYAGDLLEKDVLLAQRQMIRFFNRIPMEGKLPEVLVCVPDNNRLGGRGGDALGAASRCMQILTDNHVDFTVIREWTLDRIPAEARAILFPVPYCISDETFGQLRAFVENGGALYFSGDISFSPQREHVGDSRLTSLAGVRAATPPNPDEPWAARTIEPISAGILSPGLAMNELGKGIVMYSAAPIEVGRYSRAAMAEGWQVYSKFLATAGIEPNAVSGEDLHCFRQPCPGGGSVYVLINKGSAQTITLSTPAGKLEMALGRRKPGVVVFDGEDNVRALEVQGAATLNGKPLVDGQGHFLLTTLDGLNVRESRQIMVLPIGPGSITIHSAWADPVIELGQEEDGHWRSLGKVQPAKSAARVSFAWDEIQATGVFLLAERSQMEQAIAAVQNPLKPLGGDAMKRFPIACQTITWGPNQKNRFPEVFSEVAAAGFTGVEIGFRHIRDIPPAELKKMLDQHGLKLAATHVGGNLLNHAQANRERGMIDEVLDYLQVLGTKLLMYSGLRFENEEQFARDLGMLHRAADKCQARGVRLLYHNHSWEFADDGKVIRKLIEEGKLDFCPDIGWVMKGGWEITDFLDSIRGRVGTIHFKDFATKGPGCDTVPLGRGIVSLKHAADWIRENTNGLWVIAEQDNADIPAGEAAAISGAFLESIFK